MKKFRLPENSILVSSIAFCLIILIGFSDYETGSELSFSIFYLVPVILVASSTRAGKFLIIFMAVLAALTWFFADFLIHDYSRSFIPFWNAFVRFSIFLIIGLLIYNLKLQQRKIKIINEGLQNLNAEKNKFIGIAAHDLRSPISNIYSFTEILLLESNNKFDSENVRIINYIRELSENTLNLLKDLLDVSKIETGNVYFSLKLHDYIEFLKTKIFLNQLLADKKGIKIHLENHEAEVAFFYDEKYLSEVVDNLLSNGIKFSNYNSEIIVRVTITSGGSILTEIIDHGIGIPLDEQDKLFQYFQRSSARPTGGEESTGLGLAIAKKIVSIHGGSIGVKSELDKGSNFYFELPRRLKENNTKED